MTALPPGTEGIRLRRPLPPDEQARDVAAKLAQTQAKRNEPLIREILNRTRPVFTPNFSTAFRLLILIRFAGAMYTSISDCDETYNYWEPLHYLVKGSGFQTWEYSPLFALRSWAYLLPHALPTVVAGYLFRYDKRPAFFAVRISLALLSTFAECRMYRATVEHVSARAGRYFLAMLLFNAGMWSASSAFLPSTFALHLTTLAYSYVLAPVTSSSARRTFLCTLLFSVSALFGWPFAGLLAIPFALEELFIAGRDQTSLASRQSWLFGRFKRLCYTGMACLLIVGLPMVLIDSIAYGKLVFVPWNLVQYNIFASASGKGPELYGTEPWTFYAFNLLLSHNYIFPLALLAIPALVITRTLAPLRLHEPITKKQNAPSALEAPRLNAAGTTTLPWRLLALRAAPVYLWLATVWTQPHKEERFLFPIYTLLCWNASVTLVLVRSWAEEVFIKATASPYKAGRTSIFSTLTLTILSLTTLLGASRILALQNYYHAPFDVMHHFQTTELPRLALEKYPQNYRYLKLDPTKPPLEAYKTSETRLQFSFYPLRNDNLTLCLGEQWYRFPTRWLVPEVVEPKFVKSSFGGILPRDFDGLKGDWLWRRGGTRAVREGFNDLNKEETDRYVSKGSCDYMLDLTFPHRQGTGESWDAFDPLASASESLQQASSAVEEAVTEPTSLGKGIFGGLRRALGKISTGSAVDPSSTIASPSAPADPLVEQPALPKGKVERVFCSPFLDNAESSRVTRTLWMPFKNWQEGNRWGELCLLRRERQ